MTIQDISKVLMERNGLNKKVAAAFVNAMFDVIQQALERDRIVKVKGLGTFKIIDVEDRESVNVNTGERVLIEGHDKITFVPDTLMKELVNKPFSQFETVVLKDGVDFEDMEGKGIGETLSEDSALPLVEFGDSINVKPVILGEMKKEPVAEEPEAKEPVVENPVVEKPIIEEPLVEEPVIEEPVPEEPVVEETLAEESVVEEPVVEEPIVEEPISEESLVEDALAEEPVIEEPVAEESADEKPVEETSNEEPFYWEEEESSSKKWLIALIVGLVGLIAGYLLGSYFPLSNFLSDKVKMEQSVKASGVSPDLSDTLEYVQEPIDTTSADAIPEAPKSKTPKPEVQKSEPAQPIVAKADPQPEVDSDKYSAMDARVRTGAYKIIGTDRVVKVKEGETLVKIANRVLGPDMVCYLEVYNGLKASSELKVGQEIKVPKLQLKKKKKPQTVNE
ncbi:MAG: HU family DNA-binding protein [Prevotella sp.]|nr:HU family DNA-binding protein [Prevotella sp.]